MFPKKRNQRVSRLADLVNFSTRPEGPREGLKVFPDVRTSYPGVAMSHACRLVSSSWLAQSVLRAAFPRRALPLREHAMLFRCTVHPRGLDPFQAAKAWYLRIRDGLTWKEVRAEVRTINGAHPGQDAVEDAVAQCSAAAFA